MRTDSSQNRTLRLVGAGEEKSGLASTPFGPLKVGLIQMRPTQEVRLMELLSTLEKRVETLESKFLGVIDTFLSDTELLAEPYDTNLDGAGIDNPRP